MLNKFIIWLYEIYAKRSYSAFLNQLNDPALHQLELRKSLKVDDFPIKTYAEFPDPIPQTEKIVAYELTSGSGGKTKRIPYTKSLLKSFENMFLIWSYDVLKSISLDSHKLYFSITPQFIENKEGLKDDSDYLSGLTGFFAKRFFVQLPHAKQIKDPKKFKQALCQTFLDNPDLEIISVWSPSFLIEICETIEHDMQKEIENVFPSLVFISCWGDSHAQGDYEKIKSLFPKAIVQKKGLLATEAPLTIPLMETDLQVPLVNEIYYEFLDKKGNLLNLMEVELGETYELIISQKAGLVRYLIKDLVIIDGKYKNTPCFKFLARADKLTDLVGEKIHELDAYSALANTPCKHVLPDLQNKRYILLSETELDISFVNQIDKELRKNIHYHNARELGQLKMPVTLIVPKLNQVLSDFFEKKLFIKKGDQKIGPLIYQKPDQLISFLKDSSSSP